MSIDLLALRFKVIADYPSMPFSVNEIISENSDPLRLSYLWRSIKELKDLDNFPAIFKKLEWWEDREEKDMPEYIRFVEQNCVVKVDCLVWNIGFNFYYGESSGYGKRAFSENTVPATKEEYINQSTIKI